MFEPLGLKIKEPLKKSFKIDRSGKGKKNMPCTIKTRWKLG